MNYLGYPQAELDTAGALWTAREIAQQPQVWRKIQTMMSHEGADARSFLRSLLARRDLRIVLTGAGTSSFIGECLAPVLRRKSGLRVESLSTTDLVGSPVDCLDRNTPTLLVSFARSGNSPESLGAVDLAEQYVQDCHHLIVTCNEEGALYQRTGSLRHAHALLLPEDTNDRGFAMTSSFTGMILAASLAFDLLGAGVAETLARSATGVLETQVSFIAALSTEGFERLVYLGGGEFKGLAREAALKTLELTDGQVVALAETPLGFRHGPKTIVNAKTLVVMFLSNEEYARRYELDLLRELRADGVASRIVPLSAGGFAVAEQAVEILAPSSASNLELCFPYAVFAQTLALLRSLSLGIRSDTPNARGVVNRVVQGVTIHPWAAPR